MEEHTVIQSEVGIDIRRPSLSPTSTALVIVDMIRGYVEPDLRIGQAARDRGQFNDYYYERMNGTTLPAVIDLLGVFRRLELPVIHVRIRGDDPAAGDWPAAHRQHLVARKVLPAHPGIPEYEWASGVEPVPGEHVVEKRSISAFTTTGIAQILAARAVTHVVMAGCVTNYGVGHTAIDAVDHGFHVSIAEPATAGLSPASHEAWLESASHLYVRVCTLDAVLHELDANEATRP